MKKRKKKTAAQKKAAAKKANRSLATDGLSRRALGGMIRRRAKDLQLSRDDMAIVVGDAASQMSRLMKGHDEEFSADRLVKFLARLGYIVTLNMHLPSGSRADCRPVVVDYSGREHRVGRRFTSQIGRVL